ncbi:MAG: sigma factor-like helix-turn-helix DNA-binding protein [Candidatus Dormibacteria bacterium]
MPPRAAGILGLRYRLIDGQRYGLVEIAAAVGVTRERIRHLELWDGHHHGTRWGGPVKFNRVRSAPATSATSRPPPR